MANSPCSANPDLDPIENSGGFVPVTCLSVVDQDERPLSQSANANTRPKDARQLSPQQSFSRTPPLRDRMLQSGRPRPHPTGQKRKFDICHEQSLQRLLHPRVAGRPTRATGQSGQRSRRTSPADIGPKETASVPNFQREWRNDLPGDFRAP